MKFWVLNFNWYGNGDWWPPLRWPLHCHRSATRLIPPLEHLYCSFTSRRIIEEFESHLSCRHRQTPNTWSRQLPVPSTTKQIHITRAHKMASAALCRHEPASLMAGNINIHAASSKLKLVMSSACRLQTRDGSMCHIKLSRYIGDIDIAFLLVYVYFIGDKYRPFSIIWRIFFCFIKQFRLVSLIEWMNV